MALTGSESPSESASKLLSVSRFVLLMIAAEMWESMPYWLDGPQIDINPKGLWRTGMIWDETRGSKRWLWPKVPKGKWVNAKMAHPKLKACYDDQKPGWNDLEITAAGTKLQAVLNGVKVMEYDGAGVLDDANHRKYNVGMKGHIALQIHRGDQVKIRFKDITIKEIPSPAKATTTKTRQP